MNFLSENQLLKFLENDLESWNEQLEHLDDCSSEYDKQLGEIQYIEYLIRHIKTGNLLKELKLLQG